MEIIQERLEREYDLDLITTAPTVSYKVHKTNGEILMVSNPADLPPAQSIDFTEEPMIRVNMFTPPEYVGELMKLCQEKRGIHLDLQYLDATRCQLIYKMPLNEILGIVKEAIDDGHTVYNFVVEVDRNFIKREDEKND